MAFRKDLGSRGRARADDDKVKVREAFVNAGRHLFATEEPSKVSLRRIAAAAGYSPATIYTYFPDYRALYTAIRESDMEKAVIRFERLVARTNDPAERVKKLFMDTVEYWLDHIDHFDVLFSPPLKQPPVPAVDHDRGQPFGQSPIVVRALKVYYDAVEAFFDSLPAHPIPHRLAADTLLAAVHGIIQFPRMTRTMKWSDIAKMAEVVVNGMLDHWTAQASGKRTAARK